LLGYRKVEYHFPDIRKKIPLPKDAEKEIDDISYLSKSVAKADPGVELEGCLHERVWVPTM